jgi:Domain of unknown function (DUF4329)
VQVMSAVTAMQAAGHDEPYGTGRIVPALAKDARTGHPSSRTGRKTSESRATRHAAYDARYDNEHFSPADQTNAGRRGVPIFVGTPGGVIRKYDPATGRITTFHSTTD